MKFISRLLLLSNLIVFVNCGMDKAGEGPKGQDEASETITESDKKNNIGPNNKGANKPKNQKRTLDLINEVSNEFLKNNISIEFKEISFGYRNWFRFDIIGSNKIISAKFFPKIVLGDRPSYASVKQAVESVEQNAWYKLSKDENGDFYGFTPILEEDRKIEVEEIEDDETIEIILVLDFNDGSKRADYLRFVVNVNLDFEYDGFRLNLANKPEQNKSSFDIFGVKGNPEDGNDHVIKINQKKSGIESENF